VVSFIANDLQYQLANVMINSLLEQAESSLKERGGRMTSQRKLILEKIQSMAGHPTAEEIFLSASQEDPSLNLSTVYRTLRWLTDQALVIPRRFDEERRQERFDSIASESREDHYHFQCVQCKKIVEFSSAQVNEIKDHFSAQSGSDIFYADLILYGLCSDCRDNQP
jgi:Fe2+ or Zn2+ uptake regulation protein